MLQGAEAVRTVLQYCDISKDLQEFIDNNKLSGKRPGLYTYSTRRPPNICGAEWHSDHALICLNCNQLYISRWLIDFFLTTSRACGVRGLWQAADPGGAQSNSDNASSTTTSAYATSQKSPTETYRRAAYIARRRYFGTYVWFACRNSLVLRRFIYCYVISVLQSNTSFFCFTNKSKINTFAFF